MCVHKYAIICLYGRKHGFISSNRTADQIPELFETFNERTSGFVSCSRSGASIVTRVQECTAAASAVGLVIRSAFPALTPASSSQGLIALGRRRDISGPTICYRPTLVNCCEQHTQMGRYDASAVEAAVTTVTENSTASCTGALERKCQQDRRAIQ